MKKKLFLVGGLFVATLVVWYIAQPKTERVQEFKRRFVFDPASLPSIQSFDVEKEAKTISLAKDSKGSWIIKSESDFPAEAMRVSLLFDRISQRKLVDRVSENKGDFPSMGLDKPTSVRLNLGTGTRTIRLGNKRKGGGQYVSFDDESTAYLMEMDMDLRPDPLHWENRVLLDIPKESIRSIVITPRGGGKKLRLEREKAEEELKLVGLKKDAEVNASAIKELIDGVTKASFIGRTPLDQAPPKSIWSRPTVLELTLFNGLQYEVSYGKGGDAKMPKYYMRIAAKQPKDQAAHPEVARLQWLMERWSFEGSSYSVDQLERKESTYIVTKKAGS